MAPPSNPRLMTRILDTISILQNKKGSFVRDILSNLRSTYSSAPRTLTMQVQRALNHAVNAGILRHQSGRYKLLCTLNPIPSKANSQKTNDSKSAVNRSQNGVVKSDGKASSNGKSGRQRKEQVSKQDRLPGVKRNHSKQRTKKGLQTEPIKHTQRKSKEIKEKNRVTRHTGVDIWKWRKKQHPKKINNRKSKDPQEHRQHSSYSQETVDNDYNRKLSSKKGREIPVLTRARSRESQMTSKVTSNARKPIHEVRPMDSAESQPHLLLEPKYSSRNILEQRISDEHVTINNNNTSIEDIEQDFKSNHSESGNTL